MASHALRLAGQPNALVVGESETTRTELLSKDAILGLEILNDFALLLVDPTCPMIFNSQRQPARSIDFLDNTRSPVQDRCRVS
jgi:hypothetical protein